jgi:hypothetical protein
MLLFKKIHQLLLVTCTTIAVMLTFALLNYCSLVTCEATPSYFFITDGLLSPLTVSFVGISVILSLLLFFPPTVFKRWLQYIASWYVPLSILFVASIPITSAGLLMPSRSWVAIQAMVVLFVITIVYALIVRKRV